MDGVVAVQQDGVTVVRDGAIAGMVAIVDGLPGCGKTLLAPIVGSLARVELMQTSYQVEYTSALHYLHKIEDDAAAVLIRMFTDLQLYNMMMGRETNFRPSDLSSVWKNVRPWRYLSRLVTPGDKAAVERIAAERPILNLFTHYLLGLGRTVFAALDSRVRFIEVVRHPLYMIKQQFRYIERFGTDLRDFSIWFAHGTQALPWFARGWEEQYAQARPMERVIYMIERCQGLVEHTLAGLPEDRRRQVLFVPFERFVTDPSPYLAQVEQLLGTTATPATRRVLRRHRVPRRLFAEGLGEKIYKEYGWEAPRPGATERDEFARRREFAAQHAGADAMAVLDRLCIDYEARYLYEHTAVRSTGSVIQPS